MNGPADEDLVPVSVRLGEVVPPEDPEDWGRPLTWIAAAGMLAGPAVAFAWFWMAPPLDAGPLAGSWILAAAIAVGAVLTGSTQRGALRAGTSTLAAALFAALVVVIAGAVTADERQVGTASPTLAHAFGAGLAGVGGALAAAPLAARLASVRQHVPRVVVPAAIAIGAVLLVVPLVFDA